MKPSKVSQVVAVLAAVTIIGIAVVQTWQGGLNDSIVGALIALAVGGGLGSVADSFARAQLAKSAKPQENDRDA